ncbi:MAG: RNA polymerase sigma factor [Planctomycetes bacterium]|nr:RNA polymerase sigma factor [Planctomycetota bacterium]
MRALMQWHGGRVLGLLRSIVGDGQTAESLAQEAFFKAFRSMNRFRDGTNLRVWLLTIARNAALDHLRREKSARVIPVDIAEVPEPPEPREGPDRRLERQEESERARAAMERLPVGEREIVHLRIYEDMTWDAIAETLGIPEATARARMNRALERLRGTLGRSA